MPDLLPSDPCQNLSMQYIPQNVTRRADLPQGQPPLVALAPWMTPNCTKSYLAAAQEASAFIFYLTDNRNGKPPPVNDPTWKLNDGGSWKSENGFPVYAIPSSAGVIMMHQLGIYSESPTNGSHGDLLTADRNSINYIRLYTRIATSNQSTLPSLWAFLLIVLGVVLLLVGITSVSMHCIQRRNRQALQRRVATGEVDLEALGIKRLTVPQKALDKLPKFTYVSDERQPPNTPTMKYPQGTSEASSAWLALPGVTSKPRSLSEPYNLSAMSNNRVSTPSPPGSSSSFANRYSSYSQPTCAICLDDFEPDRTTVRELPCRHIYHPVCIDTFLTKNSSLCPICKGKVLPQGYCAEAITNAMVRRERQVRRRQEREASGLMQEVQSNRGGVSADTIDRPLAVGRHMASFHRQFGRPARTSNGGIRSSSAPVFPSGVELNDRPVVPNSHQATAEAPPGENINHSESGRRRVSALLGRQSTADDEDRERRAAMSICKPP